MAGVDILEFVKMAEVPDVIRAKALPCMVIFRSIPSMLILLFFFWSISSLILIPEGYRWHMLCRSKTTNLCRDWATCKVCTPLFNGTTVRGVLVKSLCHSCAFNPYCIIQGLCLILHGYIDGEEILQLSSYNH